MNVTCDLGFSFALKDIIGTVVKMLIKFCRSDNNIV